MPQTQITPRYYPALSSVIAPDELPELLGFLKEAITGLLDNIHFKDLQYSKSVYGDKAFYSLRIVTKNPLELEIPGTGIFLVLNPDTTDSGISSFPITVEYEWPILAYRRSFNIDNFSFSPEDFYLLALQILNLTEAQVVANAINIFTETESGNTAFEQAVIDLNVTVNTFTDNPVFDILDAIHEQLDTPPELAVLATYILKENLNVSKQNLNRFFKSLLPTDDVESYIQNLILPKFATTLVLSAGIDFPRRILQPVDPETLDVIPAENEATGAPRAGFRFGEALFYASTDKGVGYTLDIALSTNAPAMIGNTGLILEIQRLKVDLSDTENILEADLDGRPPNFQGVYAQTASITLPKRWFDTEDNHPGTTARIAGYDILVGTGGLSGTLALETIQVPDGTVTDYYADCFTFQYPVVITSGIASREIASYSILLEHLNSLNGASFNFNFPLEVLVSGTQTPQPINNQTEYADLIKGCNTAGAPPRLIKRLGGNGFEIWFTAFDITFKQNKVTGSTIQGGLKIPRLKDANGDDAEIEIFGHFDDTGDFLVSASEKDGLKPFGIKNVIQFYLKSVELGKENDDFFVGCACDIAFPNPVMRKLIGDQRIQIQRMRFYSDGSFEILGGTIPVPANFTLNLGPVEVAITNINLGAYQQEYKGKTRKYMVFGFDGAVGLGSLGFEARGKGMQYYFTVDRGEFHSEFRIQTIEADIIIPGNASPESATAIIKGYLSIPQPGESKEYTGGVSVKIPKAKISGSAEFRLQPRYPAYIVDASIDLPIAIPIVPPVSITGFRGLFGHRYIAEKEAVGLTSGPGGDTWYDYYTYPRRGVNLPKFRGPDASQNARSGFSIGAGATLQTSDGALLSARVMFILSQPSLFVFDGRANILGPALGLDDTNDPPFFAFVAIGDRSLELGSGIDFKLPKSNGNLISLKVGMEAYFPFQNASAWYIHLGTRQKPNEARIFTLITMQSYLELSARGMAMGARADFNFDKRFGPAKVKAWLYAEVGGAISFERPQIGGYVAAGGGAEVSFWILTVGISLDALFGAEVPKPFKIQASVRVCGRIKLGFIKIRKCLTVDIKWEFNKRVDTTPVPPLPNHVASENVKGISMLTGETFDLLRIQSGFNSAPSNNLPVLPLDTYIDIKTLKPLNPSAVRNKIGGYSNRAKGSIELIPPQASSRGRSFRQVEHEYSIDAVNIDIWNGSTWVSYNPYKAITIEDEVNVNRLKAGVWQKSGAEYNAIRLLGDTPFSYIQRGESGWFVPEQVGISSESLFCEHTFDYWKRANWRNVRIGRRYPLVGINPNADLAGATAFNVNKFYSHQNLAFTIIGNQYEIGGSRSIADYARVAKTYSPNFDFSRGLQFNNTNPLVLKYRNPVRSIRLKLNTGAQGVNFIFYKAVFDNLDTPGASTQVRLEAFETVQANAETLETAAFEYTATGDNTISQIKIIPNVANAEDIAALRAQIEALQDGVLDVILENTTSSETEEAELETLLERLEALEAQSCKIVEIPCTGIGDMMVTNDFIVGKETENVPPLTRSICHTTLFEAEWLHEFDFKLISTLPDQQAITEEFEAATDAITKVVEPIWRPDAQYRIHFQVADTVQGNKTPYDFYFGFATSGPVGHHPVPIVNYGTYKNAAFQLNLSQEVKDKYAHTTLRQYIDYKRSYPNANGNLLQSKPLFYGTEGGNNKLSLFYLKAYAYHMLRDWPAYDGVGEAISNTLQVIVKDPVEDILLQNPPAPDSTTTEIPSAQVAWTTDTNALFPTEYQMYSNLANGDNCMGVDAVLTIPKRYVTEVTVNNMKPQKMYTAILNAVYKQQTKEVHNFVFQTSRYKNFNEQVNSYLLKENPQALQAVNQAIFNLDIAITNDDLKRAYNLVASNIQLDPKGQQLQIEKADIFDRVTEGLFKLPPLDPAATTEFNFIRNTETGAIVALLVRNPEPFNDPKIDVEVINGTENPNNQGVAILSGNVPDQNYKILHAKDYSQFLVMYNMNNTIAITAENLNMRFNYLLWDGFAYRKQGASVNVTINVNFKE